MRFRPSLAPILLPGWEKGLPFPETGGPGLKMGAESSRKGDQSVIWGFPDRASAGPRAIWAVKVRFPSPGTALLPSRAGLSRAPVALLSARARQMSPEASRATTKARFPLS
jgi:hypothetical protein